MSFVGCFSMKICLRRASRTGHQQKHDADSWTYNVTTVSETVSARRHVLIFGIVPASTSGHTPVCYKREERTKNKTETVSRPRLSSLENKHVSQHFFKTWRKRCRGTSAFRTSESPRGRFFAKNDMSRCTRKVQRTS